jgi:hypothetical protein
VSDRAPELATQASHGAQATQGALSGPGSSYSVRERRPKPPGAAPEGRDGKLRRAQDRPGKGWSCPGRPCQPAGIASSMTQCAPRPLPEARAYHSPPLTGFSGRSTSA